MGRSRLWLSVRDGVTPAVAWRLLAAAYVVLQALTMALTLRGLPADGVPGLPYSKILLDMTRAPWLSLDLWAGVYPAGYPVILRIFGSGWALYVVQAGAAMLAWLWLAWEVKASTRNRWVGLAGAVWLLGLSLAPEVSMWHQLLMTESMASTGLVALLALSLRWFRSPSATMLWASLPVVILWILIRPSNVVAVLFVGTVALIAAAWGRRKDLAILGVVCVVLVAGFASLAQPHRGQPALKWVVRVGLQDPEVKEFLVERSMPDGPAVDDLASEAGPLSDYIDVAASDPRLEEFRQWMAQDAASAYVAWLASEPDALLAESMRSFAVSVGTGIERDEAEVLVTGIAASTGNQPEDVPLPLGMSIGSALWIGPHGALVAVLAYIIVAATVVGMRRDGRRDGLWVVGWLTLAFTPPYLLSTFLGDVVEPMRHGLIGATTLRLAMVMLLVWSFDAMFRRPQRPPDQRSTSRDTRSTDTESSPATNSSEAPNADSSPSELETSAPSTKAV